MAIIQLDSENADLDLTSLVTILTDTPDASNHILCQGYVELGYGAKNLDGSGGMFELVVTVGDHTIQPSPQIVGFGTEVRSALWTTIFPVPYNTEVILKVKSPNGADTDIDVMAYLFDVSPFATEAKQDTMQTAIDDIPNAVWDEELTGLTHNVPTSAGRRLRSVGEVTSSTINDAGASTTVFITALTETTDDHYNNQLIYFTDGNLKGQVGIIKDYDGDTKAIMVDFALTEAPGNGDTFDIIPTHVHTMEHISQGVWNDLTAEYVTPSTFGKAVTDILAEFDGNSSLGISFKVLLERSYQMINNRMTVNEVTGDVALRTIGDGGDLATGNVASSSGTTTRAELF